MSARVFVSLTNILHSNTGLGARPSHQLVFGEGADSLTMRPVLCLREERNQDEEGGDGLEVHVLHDQTVVVRETMRMPIRPRRPAQSYEFPWNKPRRLTHGERVMGTIVPMLDSEHAVEIHLGEGIVLEKTLERYTRCWHCLTGHVIRKEYQRMCGHHGCRAVLPPLSVPYPMEQRAFEPFPVPQRRVG